MKTKRIHRASHRLILAALILALLAPTLAAQDLTVQGKMDAGFGLRESDVQARVWDPVGAAAIVFNATLGRFTAMTEIGMTEDALFDYGEHLITWRVTDLVALSFSGAAPELPGVDGLLGVLAGEGTGAPGDFDVFFDYSDAGLFYVDVGSEAFTFSLAASDNCVPECGIINGVDATEGRNSFLIIVRGHSGAIGWQAYGVRSQGRDAGGTQGTGSGGGGSVEYKSESFRLAADLAAGRVNCVSTCTDPIKLANRGLALMAGGFGIQFARLSTDEGAGTRTEEDAVDVVYHFSADPGIVYGPQYSTATTDNGTTETTERFLWFVIAAEF